MLQIKACPRCHGDLVETDEHGEAMASCVQCGFVRYAQVVASIVEPERARVRVRRAA